MRDDLLITFIMCVALCLADYICHFAFILFLARLFDDADWINGRLHWENAFENEGAPLIQRSETS